MLRGSPMRPRPTSSPRGAAVPPATAPVPAVSAGVAGISCLPTPGSARRPQVVRRNGAALPAVRPRRQPCDEPAEGARTGLSGPSRARPDRSPCAGRHRDRCRAARRPWRTGGGPATLPWATIQSPAGDNRRTPDGAPARRRLRAVHPNRRVRGGAPRFAGAGEAGVRAGYPEAGAPCGCCRCSCWASWPAGAGGCRASPGQATGRST